MYRKAQKASASAFDQSSRSRTSNNTTLPPLNNPNNRQIQSHGDLETNSIQQLDIPKTIKYKRPIYRSDFNSDTQQSNNNRSSNATSDNVMSTRKLGKINTATRHTAMRRNRDIQKLDQIQGKNKMLIKEIFKKNTKQLSSKQKQLQQQGPRPNQNRRFDATYLQRPNRLVIGERAELLNGASINFFDMMKTQHSENSNQNMETSPKLSRIRATESRSSLFSPCSSSLEKNGQKQYYGEEMNNGFNTPPYLPRCSGRRRLINGLKINENTGRKTVYQNNGGRMRSYTWNFKEINSKLTVISQNSQTVQRGIQKDYGNQSEQIKQTDKWNLWNSYFNSSVQQPQLQCTPSITIEEIDDLRSSDSEPEDNSPELTSVYYGMSNKNRESDQVNKNIFSVDNVYDRYNHTQKPQMSKFPQK